MCGIFAALSKSTDDDCGPVLPREVVEQALAALHHRGPDGTGYKFSNDGSVVLGQARLAIIGLDDAAGAMVNEDGSVFAVVNGEFYDFERIRQELQAEGHRFSTDCDSEILVHLYEEYGIDCLKHLRGEFAFVLLDQKQNRLFAARDRFGIKPFVYAEIADRLLFASEAKALFAAGLPCAWDHESFYYSASIQYVLPDRTLFQSVHQLPPGHMLIFENGRLR
ncbi:MAG TPA: asparagine synthetase B, partial [Candidatus Melainabacteria bacterium]|nr:asparagine synthetase B [Candidatus Melainabacteria bacterium]